MTTVVVEKAVIVRAIDSLNRACDLTELGLVDDAIETLNLVLDDLEPLRTEKGDAREDAALKSLPHRRGRTDDEDCSARSG